MASTSATAMTASHSATSHADDRSRRTLTGVAPSMSALDETPSSAPGTTSGGYWTVAHGPSSALR